MIKKMFFICILLFGSVNFSFSEDYSNFLIKIGLNYNGITPEIVTVDSSENLAIFSEHQNLPIKEIEIDRKTVNFSQAKGYNIIFSKKFESINQLKKEFDSVLNSDKNSYIYYNDGYYLCFGEYSTEKNATSAISKVSGVNKSNLLVLPFYNSIKIYDGEKVYFMYNSGISDYFVCSEKYPASGLVQYGGSNYRGGIGFKVFDGNSSIINYLLLDHYVYGVLPKEMPKTWPEEALKAQAVVVRSFAISNLNKHMDSGYNLCSTSNCQVYGGYDAETEMTNRATNETTGEILYYGDDVVNGFYHSNSGGMTESSENVWGGAIPYLAAVEDSYSLEAPNSTWSYSISPVELAVKLKDYGADIGSVKSVNILEKSSSGRVKKLLFSGSYGNKEMEREEVRKFLGYSNIKSTLYDISGSREAYALNDEGKILTNLTTVYCVSKAGISKVNEPSIFGENKVDLSSKGNEFVFVGKGSGHGVGMSQWGAKIMAEKGFEYQDILYHYYANTNIRK